MWTPDMKRTHPGRWRWANVFNTWRTANEAGVEAGTTPAVARLGALRLEGLGLAERRVRPTKYGRDLVEWRVK